MIAAVRDWLDTRRQQRAGFWYDPDKWHRTPYRCVGRYLRRQTWRRRVALYMEEAPDLFTIVWEYATEADMVRTVLRERFGALPDAPKIYPGQLKWR
jgi:hypothetical protein